MKFSLCLQVLAVCFVLEANYSSARDCLCVHKGTVLPVDQHITVTELPGGTCVEILKEHVHFKNANWTHIMYQGHHAFVEKINTAFDKVKCDDNNVPITTTVASTTRQTTQSTTQPTTRPTTPVPQTTTMHVTTTLHQGTTLPPAPFCPPTSGKPSHDNLNCTGVKILSRSSWEASSQYESINDLTRQFSCSVDFVVVHHTLGDRCVTLADCEQRIRTDIQNWQHRQFNFAIGGDGTIYELNGFDSVAKHANFYDNISLGIAFIGDFSSVPPTQAAIDSLKKFLACAVHERLLAAYYVLRTERDVIGTGFGDALYSEIEKLQHY
ncbi:uncharacterized protein [Mytilus edulis]|uniref:uncharacterized protein n=1 Tax=Mytilus edulis TaxID=6550 RepID=UPI0039F110D9